MVRKKRSSISYEVALDIQKIAEDICLLMFPHIKIERVKCFRSYGSSTRRTIARCHGMSKIIQLAIGDQAWYALEFITEKFGKLSYSDQIKTIIHELMHIPYNFGGGFKHHDHVTEGNVNKFYNDYISKKEDKDEIKKSWF